MTPDQFQRVKALYLEFESLPADERIGRLEEACADDPVVREYVSNMLKRATTDDELLSDVTGRIKRILASSEDRLVDLVGQRIGAYEIQSVLGRGGMGIVYRARDSRLDRPAALKAMLPEVVNSDSHLQRFRREARVLASLSHPNIATVFGLEETEGTLLIAMEFIEGKTLAARLSRGSMSIETSLHTCQQVAAGVEAAHEAGVIHRDLKPANIMYTRDDTVKVLDFGLAREISGPWQGDSQPMSLTRAGSLFGTPAYMSPEQARGEPLDERSDIFSFGAVLYRCLTGRSPFSGETSAEIIESVLSNEADLSLLPQAVPPSIRSLLARCLAKRASDRYRHIGDVRMDLADAIKAREWEPRKVRASAKDRMMRAAPWAAAIVLGGIAAVMLATQWGGGAATVRESARRFDLTLPDDAPQRDLERLQLSLSPDGRSVVIACQTAAGQGLWVRSHQDGQWRAIDGTQNAHRPTFSSDGEWVFFYRENYVFKQRITGRGDPIRVAPTTNWYGISALPDGRVIFSPAWGSPLAMVGEKEINVTKVDETKGEVSHISPSHVADSPWLLYDVWLGGDECYVDAVNLQTGETHRVAGNASCGRAVKTPRGDYLLFERSSIIFAAPFNRSTATIKGPETAIAEGVLNDGTRFSSYFDASDDGTLVYFPGSAFSEESRMAYVNPDGSSMPVNDDRLGFIEPNFSGDGSLLAVGIKGKIYRTLLYNLKQKTREYMITGGDTLSQALSPDGRHLVMTINRDGGYGVDLYSVAEVKRLRRLVEPGADYQSDLTYSADGKYIAFSMSPAKGQPRDVWALDLENGGKPRQIVSTPAGENAPSFSPDGRWLAYASNESGRSEIYLVSFPKGDITRQITSTGGESPVWSRDGKRLYYVSEHKLRALDVTPDGLVTGQRQDVYTQPFGQSDPLGKNFTVAPDGQVMVIEPSERRPGITHLHVVTHWYDLLPK